VTKALLTLALTFALPADADWLHPVEQTRALLERRGPKGEVSDLMRLYAGESGPMLYRFAVHPGYTGCGVPGINAHAHPITGKPAVDCLIYCLDLERAVAVSLGVVRECKRRLGHRWICGYKHGPNSRSCKKRKMK
jgi:hypothetical protein